VVLVGESEAFSLGESGAFWLGESEARFGTVGTAAADGECEGGNLYRGEVWLWEVSLREVSLRRAWRDCLWYAISFLGPSFSWTCLQKKRKKTSVFRLHIVQEKPFFNWLVKLLESNSLSRNNWYD
jgi:hypothetical protein